MDVIYDAAPFGHPGEMAYLRQRFACAPAQVHKHGPVCEAKMTHSTAALRRMFVNFKGPPASGHTAAIVPSTCELSHIVLLRLHLSRPIV